MESIDEMISVRSLVDEALGALGNDSICRKYAEEIETYFAIPADTIVDLSPNAAALAATGNLEVLGRFDRWKCIRCVAANIALAAAITTAIVAYGPASPGVVQYIAAKFGISEAVAAAAVGGLNGAALAKRLCPSC